MRGKVVAWLAAWTLLLTSPEGVAGGLERCRAPEPRPEAVADAFRLAARITDTAEREDVQLALIARVGQDLSRFGVHYSHLGFLLREGDGWRVIHEFNLCEEGRPGLFSTGPASFFMDDPHRLESALVIPSAPLQAALLSVLSGQTPGQLRGQRYNFLAYPRSTTDQNCTQWVAELLAAALARMRGEGMVTSRELAQSYLSKLGMRPATIPSTFQLRWYARAFGGKDASLAGQPDPQLLSIITADNVMDFLRAQDRAQLIVIAP